VIGRGVADGRRAVGAAVVRRGDGERVVCARGCERGRDREEHKRAFHERHYASPEQTVQLKNKVIIRNRSTDEADFFTLQRVA
jgi:hypothetical protein